jgi:hypothetical protein
VKLSINFSTQAAALLAEGRIQLDFFKCPDWPHLIDEARGYAPVAVHFSLSAGNGSLEDETDWELVERLLTETITPYVNVHIDPSTERYADVSVDNPTREQAARIIENTTKDLACLVRRFGASMVIAENSPYHAGLGSVIRTAVEPEVIAGLIQYAGCGLLLDLSHAFISAHYLGIDEWDYLARLPMHHLREMHFTGIHLLDGRLVDHLPALPADWSFLEKSLEHIRTGKWAQPWMLAFEYGGVGKPFAWRSETTVMAEQMPVLWQLVRSG